MRIDMEVATGRGAPQRLSVEAASEAEARAEATRMGYVVLGAAPNGLGLPLRSTVFRRRATIDVIIFVEQLRDLLNAGLGVGESLETMRRGSAGLTRSAIGSIEGRLQEGKSLAQALRESGLFPELLLALVRASELTSDLQQALSRFLEHEQRVAEVRHRITSTAIYPILLVAVGGAVLLFLLFYVMPRFARVFAGISGDLPWSARAMIGWSDLLQRGGMWWLAGLVLLVGLGLGAMAEPRLRAAAWRRLLDLSLLRGRLRVYALARWYRATGMLVQGGIPLITSLRLSNGLLPADLQAGGAAVEDGVRRGLSPAQAHAQAGMATPVAEQLMLAGERTGDLGSVLSRIAQFHEAEVTRSLERAMRALEPVVMVLIGLGVGVVVLLMYLPIFELASAIQ